jgi:hypothetical protein
MYEKVQVGLWKTRQTIQTSDIAYLSIFQFKIQIY